ncbi:MAG TPA: NADH-quinone oxidoreductase subunit L, partial [Candidatus Lokiarchaeia archaeon]|nr:NADH-quinone oxidoreductase subunit L [Candidatus Lokiarchaeia archaeon]
MLPYALNAWLVWGIPLGASLLVPLVARIGPRTRNYFALVVSIITAVFAFSMIPDIFSGTFAGTEYNVDWIPMLGISAGVLVDPLSVLFAVLVAFFGVIIIIYSLGYMTGEEGQTRYYFLLLLFIGSMIGLVMSDNFLMLFIFWEMVGLCSYALVSFWYKKTESVNAGIKIFLMTRIGDVFLLAAIAILYVKFGTFSFSYIMAHIGSIDMPTITIIAFCILGGAVAKSAQLPLHTWLFSAMEAPTSISALLHAATMVKAGVYLLARAIVIFSVLPLINTVSGAASIPNWLPTIAWIGILTAVIGGTLAVSTPDIKGVQAYSTISQLGFMIAALGTAASNASSGWFASIYQVLSHAFFQGLNFLIIGGIIHATGTRDMRQMGGLRKDMPTTFWFAVIYFVTVIGIYPFPSFFSKELIIGSIWATNNVAWIILIYIATALTVAYSLRYLILTFLGEKSAYLENNHHVHEPPKTMLFAAGVLAALCLIFGFLGSLLGNFMHVTPEVSADVGLGAVINWTTLVFIGVLFLGLLPVYFNYIRKSPGMKKFLKS